METARKEVSDSLVVEDPMRVVLRSVVMVSGEWCVVMDGIQERPQWFAESWDTQTKVIKGREEKGVSS